VNDRLKRIRNSEKISHTEIYTNEKLYHSDSWLRKPIKTIQDIIPLFNDKHTLRVLDLGSGIGRNSIYIADKCRDKECRIDCVDILDIAIVKLMENAAEYGVEHSIYGEVKTIEEYEITPDTYDLIMAVSALEHVDNEASFARKLGQIREGIASNGIVCLVINSEVSEEDAERHEVLEPQFEVNLSTVKVLSYLEESFLGWSILKQSVVHQEYEIPRGDIVSKLSTSVITFVAKNVR